jgi:signal transduction histidine kinase
MNGTDHAPTGLWSGQRLVDRWRLAARADVLLACIVLLLQLAGAAAATANSHSGQAHLNALTWVLVVIGPIALVFRRRQPVVVLWVCLAATLAPSGSWATNLSLLVAFVLAAIGGNRHAAWLAAAAGFICSVWLVPFAAGRHVASVQFGFLLLGWLAVLLVAAEVVRIRGVRRAEALRVQVVEARRRAGDERLRMARELHDVISHNIALISIQAAVGLDLMDAQPEQARVSLAAIRTVANDALNELRGVLTALRSDGNDAAPRSPTPHLARLPELIELSRAAGISVTTQTVGQARPLPAAVDTAAYRVVQESLTNVARHAPQAKVRVRIGYEASALVIEVNDDGGRRPGKVTVASGGGNGVVGMRERVAVLGGDFVAGPGPRGGWLISARFPLAGTS